MAWDEATDEEEADLGRSSTSVAFRRVRELLGLDQLELAITGAAPIPAELLAWYRAIGVPLSEIYGMSENTGPDDLDAVPDQARHGRPRHARAAR